MTDEIGVDDIKVELRKKTPKGSATNMFGKEHNRSLQRYNKIRDKIKTDFEISSAKKHELKTAPGMYGFTRRRLSDLNMLRQNITRSIYQSVGNLIRKRFVRQNAILDRSRKPDPKQVKELVQSMELYRRIKGLPGDLQENIASLLNKPTRLILKNYDGSMKYMCEDIGEIIQNHVESKETPINILALLTELHEYIVSQFSDDFLANPIRTDMMHTILSIIDGDKGEWPVVFAIDNPIVTKFFPRLSELTKKSINHYKRKISNVFSELSRFIIYFKDGTLKELFDIRDPNSNSLPVNYKRKIDIFYKDKTADGETTHVELTENGLLAQILCFVVLEKEEREFVLNELSKLVGGRKKRANKTQKRKDRC